MTADRLLRLYPRNWRDRYGEEFLQTVGSGALRIQQVVDIVSGAIDAWLSPEVRKTTRADARNKGREDMVSAYKMVCRDKVARYSKRDALIGAAVMVLSTLLFVAVGTYTKRQGWTDIGEAILSLAFPTSLLFSMPFSYLKGQPWRAQVVFVAVPFAILIGIGYLSTLI